MKNIVITGATGSIGSYVLYLLSQNAELNILYLGRTEVEKYKSFKNISFYYCDLLNLDSEKLYQKLISFNADSLIHLAWSTEPQWDDISNYQYLSSSIELAKTFIDSGGKSLLAIGTYAEVVPNHQGIIKEDSDIQLINSYVFCKHSLFNILQRMCLEHEVRFVWPRVFSSFGNEKANRLTKLIFDFIEENTTNNTNLDKTFDINYSQLQRDYVYYKDVANAIVCLLLHSNCNGIYNISSGNSVSIKNFVHLISDITHRHYPIILKELPTSQILSIKGDNSKLVKDCNFKFKYSIKDALIEILKERKIIH